MRRIQEEAYQLYKIDWEATHVPVETQISPYRDYSEAKKSCEIEEDETYEDYVWENGYGTGTIFVCFEEFLGAEYRDEEYMRYLLREGTSLWEEYLEDVRAAAG